MRLVASSAAKLRLDLGLGERDRLDGLTRQAPSMRARCTFAISRISRQMPKRAGSTVPGCRNAEAVEDQRFAVELDALRHMRLI